MPGRKLMITITKEMDEALEEERLKRKLEYKQEVVKQILGEYFAKRNSQREQII